MSMSKRLRSLKADQKRKLKAGKRAPGCARNVAGRV